MSTGVGNFNSILSNIIHKFDVRVNPLKTIAGALKEFNRKRHTVLITANNTAVTLFVAPWNGSLESLVVSSPAATTSTSGNHVTITVTDLTKGTTLLSFDTYTNALELVQNQGTPIVMLGTPQISPATGLPVTEFSQFDVLQITVQVTGTPGITTSSVLPILWTVFPTDAHYAA